MKLLIRIDLPIGISYREVAEMIAKTIEDNADPDYSLEPLEEFDLVAANGDKVGVWRTSEREPN